MFFFYCYDDHRDLHSFPTRRSSDLYRLLYDHAPGWDGVRVPGRVFTTATLLYALLAGARSEEHTSELQSRFELVCRLLLEKKNDKVMCVKTTRKVENNDNLKHLSIL